MTRPKTLIKRSRSLRKKSTTAEQKMWQRLRRDQVLGLSFRRQHPVEPYIADFCCSAAKVIVEIDGDFHAGREEYDEKRQEELEKKGFLVLRFTNVDVANNINGVMQVIYETCQGRLKNPSPQPSPRKRGEGVRE